VELRPHQWSKNLLVLVAVGTSHRYTEWTSVAHAILSGLLFCLASSSVYLVNDLLDLQADRLHPTKKYRPLARGDVSIPTAIALAIFLALVAVWGSAQLDHRLALAVGLYLAASLLYSIWIKEFLVVDVVMLACLYVLRVVAGGFAIGIWLSFWTFAFSLFFFFSLALMKRYSELRIRQELDDPQTNRRAYRISDTVQLDLLGVASSLVAVLIVGLYIDGPDVKRLYANPAILWFLCPLLLYWCGRQWILAGRGEMNEDPVAFALHDWRSYIVGVLAAITVIAAT
jgi:4-hydroxybenzoate polyprenyltransferase